MYNEQFILKNISINWLSPALALIWGGEGGKEGRTDNNQVRVFDREIKSLILECACQCSKH